MFNSNINKIVNLFMSLLVLFCIARFTLVMTTDISLFNLTNIIIAGTVAIGFFSVTSYAYRKEFLGLNTFFLLFCLMMVGITVITCVDPDYYNTASAYFKQLVVLIVIWGIYVYMSKSSPKNVKWLVFSYIMFIAISAGYTAYVALVGDKDIIRLTASGIFDSNFAFIYGGFDFIYALVLVYTALFTVLRNMWKQIGATIRILLVVLEFLFAFTIIVSGYGTAFTLILIFTLWQLIPKGIIRLTTIVVILAIVFIFPTLITNVISAIPFIPESTSSRLNDLILFISGQGSFGYITDEGQRIDRILWSLRVFWENPVFGGYIGGTALRLGNHTEWIDQLARYGLITTVFNAAFWMLTYKKIKKDTLMSEDSKVSYKCFNNTFIMFVILGFLDPISMVITVCPLLILAPFLSAVVRKEET